MKKTPTRNRRTKEQLEKNKHAQEMAYLRSKSLTPERRSEIAKKASISRWNKAKKISTDNLA